MPEPEPQPQPEPDAGAGAGAGCRSRSRSRCRCRDRDSPHQPKTTLVSFAVISMIIIARHFFLGRKESQHLNLIVTATRSLGVSVESICDVVGKNASQLHLRRYDQNADQLELTFLIGLKDFQQFEACRAGLSELSPEIGISYLDPQSYL